MGKYLFRVTEDSKEHGFKARFDIIDILQKQGYEIVDIKTYIESNYKNMFKDLFNNKKALIKSLNNIKNSEIVFQFPWNSMMYCYSKIIKNNCKKNNNTSTLIIHDITSIRTTSKFGVMYFNYLVKEFKYMNNFDKIIVHNNKMKKLLVDHNVDSSKIVSLDIFDYLLDGVSENIINKKFKSIIIAGNLNRTKAGYVYELHNLKHSNFSVELYGVNYDAEKVEGINYHGSFKPNELVNELNFGFGLVWDGLNLDTCSGKYGEYMKYNNPHKLSLYMACGIPVIVWKDSAIAEFVKKNNLGICIKSLNDLDKIFSKMTSKEYNQYVKNVKVIHDRVIKGDYILDALNKNIK